MDGVEGQTAQVLRYWGERLWDVTGVSPDAVQSRSSSFAFRKGFGWSRVKEFAQPCFEPIPNLCHPWVET